MTASTQESERMENHEDLSHGSDSSTDDTDTGTVPDDPPVLTQDKLYEILADKRRRYTVHYLKQVNEPVTVQELAEQVAAWENQKSVEALDSQERKRVYISLYQGHLSTLDGLGVIDYDDDQGVVELTEGMENTDIYLEIVNPRNIPWSQFYLGLSVVNLLLIALAWLEVGVFADVSTLAVATFIVASFGFSAAVQYLQGGRIQLGDDGPPPELRET